MAILNEQALRGQIKQGSYFNAYLFYGEESYLKEHYVNMLKKKLLNPAFESFNLHSYEGADIDFDDVLKDAQMLPAMSEYNLVIVTDYAVEKSKPDMKLLEEYFSDCPDSTVFIMVYKALSPDTKCASFKKLISAFDKAGAAVNLEKRSESDIARLLVSGAKKRSSELNTDNARYLISICGNDMQVLLNELDKLAGFAKDREITKEIIDNMAAKCLQARIYDLSKAVVSGNADRAYNVINTLFEMKEEPIIIMSAIGGAYVDMYRVKCAKAAGKGYDDVAAHYNYRGREFALRNATRDCAALSEGQLRSSLDAVMDTDLKLKSTAADKRMLIEELVAKLLMISRGGLNA